MELTLLGISCLGAVPPVSVELLASEVEKVRPSSCDGNQKVARGVNYSHVSVQLVFIRISSSRNFFLVPLPLVKGKMQGKVSAMSLLHKWKRLQSSSFLRPVCQLSLTDSCDIPALG